MSHSPRWWLSSVRSYTFWEARKRHYLPMVSVSPDLPPRYPGLEVLSPATPLVGCQQHPASVSRLQHCRTCRRLHQTRYLLQACRRPSTQIVSYLEIHRHRCLTSLAIDHGLARRGAHQPLSFFFFSTQKHLPPRVRNLTVSSR